MMTESNVKVSDIVAIKEFEAVINAHWVWEDKGERLVRNYCLTTELAQKFERILESFTERRANKSTLEGHFSVRNLNQAFFADGTYGSGKSYFLLMLMKMLESVSDDEERRKMINKFRHYPAVVEHLKRLEGRRYFTVFINAEGKGGEYNLTKLLMSALQEKLEEEFGSESFGLGFEFETAVKSLHDMQESIRGEIIRRLDVSNSKELENKLRAQNTKVLGEFYEALEELMGGYRPDRVDFNIIQVVTQCRDYLTDRGYEGLVFVVDEFSQYVKETADSGHWNLSRGQLQQFANQVCNDLRNRVWFIGAKHEELVDIVEMTKSQAEEIRQLDARFTQINLPLFEPHKLLNEVIDVDIERLETVASHVTPSLSDLASIAEEYDDVPGFAKYYPMHPSVVHYLPRVSSAVASSERTTFRFILENVKRKYVDSQELATIHDSLNLVTLDELYDYFSENLRPRNMGSVADAVNIVVDKYSADSEQVRMVKALAASNLAVRGVSDGTNVEVSMSAQNVASSLNFDDVEFVHGTLEEMKDTIPQGVVRKDSDDKFYFSAEMSPSAEPIVNEYRDRADPSKALRDWLLDADESFINHEYEIGPESAEGVRVKRRGQGHVMGAEEFMNCCIPDKIDDDFWCIVIIPRFNEMSRWEKDDFEQKVFNAVSEKAKDNIIVSVPRNVSMLEEEDWLYLAQINHALADETRSFSSQIDDSLQRLYNDKSRTPRLQAQRFGSDANFDFLCNNQKFEGDTYTTVFLRVVASYYSEFPQFGRESVTQHAVNDLIRKILPDPKQISTSKSDSSHIGGRQGHIVQTLGRLGLVDLVDKGDRYVGKVTKPRKNVNPESHKIWELLTGCYPDVCPGLAKSIDDTYKVLKSAPYGLTDQIIELYLMAVLGVEHYVLHDKSGEVINLPDRLSTVSNDGDSQFSFRPPTTFCLEEKQSIRRVLETVGGDQQIVPLHERMDKNEVCSNARKVFRQIPEDAFVAERLFTNMEINTDELERATSWISKIRRTADSDKALDMMKRAGENNELLQILELMVNLNEKYKNIDTLYGRVQMMIREPDITNQYVTDLEIAVESLKNNPHDLPTWDSLYEVLKNIRREYLKSYKDTHSQLNKIRREFITRIEELPAYSTLQKLDGFGLSGFTTAGDIASKIKKVRTNICRRDLHNTMSRETIHFQRECSSCKMTLSDMKSEISRLTKELSQLESKIQRACTKISDKLLECSDNQRLTLSERCKSILSKCSKGHYRLTEEDRNWLEQESSKVEELELDTADDLDTDHHYIHLDQLIDSLKNRLQEEPKKRLDSNSVRNVVEEVVANLLSDSELRLEG